MYTHRRYPISVRARTPRYGDHPLPLGSDGGQRALGDLKTAPTAEIPLIVARYAALRAWALCHDSTRGDGGADGRAVRSHALSAAVEQLESTAGGWPEITMLRKALARPKATRTARLMESAAAAAEAMGHFHGARALREAVHRIRWASLRFGPPSRS